VEELLTKALVKALDGKVLCLLDWMFLKMSQHPEVTILMNLKISLTQHIGACDRRTGIELH
jgi:hypothetical protein